MERTTKPSRSNLRELLSLNRLRPQTGDTHVISIVFTQERARGRIWEVAGTPETYPKHTSYNHEPKNTPTCVFPLGSH